MKKFFNNVKARFNKTTASVKARVECAKVAVENKLGEGYIDTAVKIIIGVVIGGVLLSLPIGDIGFYRQQLVFPLPYSLVHWDRLGINR